MAIAYGVFLFLLWLWLRLRRADFEPFDFGIDGPDGGDATRPESVSADGFSGRDGKFGGGGASGKFDGLATASDVKGSTGDAPAGFGGGLDAVADVDEAALPLVVIVALWALLLALLGGALALLAGAPGLFAELLLDGVLAGGLYRRLRRLPRRHWLEIALRRTALLFAAAGALVAGSGFLMQQAVPTAHTLGQVVSQALNGVGPR